jgi:hypothetical protein
MNDPPTAAARIRPSWWWAVLALLAGAVLLRLAVLGGELWFDEVWSWEFARRADSPVQVFVGPEHHHDNNHKLNTLYLYLLPDGLPFWTYRLHSLAAGLALVLTGVWIARRRGRAEAAFAAALLASNYWLVLYGAEARGYALAIAFAFLALAALESYLENHRARALPVFWAAVALGFLSHLTFLFTYLALGLWSVYHNARRRTSPRAELLDALRVHGPPALFCVALYLLDLRGTQLGGGDALPASAVLGRLLGLGLGVGPAPFWLVGPPVLAAILAGLYLLRREGSSEWVFFAVVLFTPPALFLVKRTPFVFERYFLISFAFFLLLLSYLLGRAWRHAPATRAVAVGLALLIALGNAASALHLARDGRGHFLDALTLIEHEAPGPEVTLTADHDFRTTKMLAFYAPYLRTGKALHYYDRASLPEGGVEWMIVHRTDELHPPGPVVHDGRGNTYHLVRAFRVSNYAGWHWFVYRNAESPPGYIPVLETPGPSRKRQRRKRSLIRR